jgi:hypothetical protein
VVQIALLCAIMFTFSLGPGPFTLVVVNEMLPLQLRARVVSAAILLNRIGSGTVAFTFLSLSQNVFCPGGAANCASNGTNTSEFGIESDWHHDPYGPQTGFGPEGYAGAPGTGGGAATPLQIGTARTFYLYGGLGFGITAFYYAYLPDLQGESLEGGEEGTSRVPEYAEDV